MIIEPVDIQALVDEIIHERDEIALQIHLAKAELRDEWQELEHKWERMKLKGSEAAAAADESAGDIWEVALELRDEIKEGYKRIKKALK